LAPTAAANFNKLRTTATFGVLDSERPYRPIHSYWSKQRQFATGAAGAKAPFVVKERLWYRVPNPGQLSPTWIHLSLATTIVVGTACLGYKQTFVSILAKAIYL